MPPIGRIDTVIATTDQLQAELSGVYRELILVYCFILALLLLYAVLAWKVGKLNR